MTTTLPLPEPATAGQDKRETDVGSVFVSNYPPFSAWSAEAVSDYRAALSAPPRPDTPLGLYLHIPFCRKRCKFCYFRVYTDKNYDEIGTYLDALATEVELYADEPAVAGRALDFVYVGGGTPSYIAADQLVALAERLGRALPWSGAREVTFECEPGTLKKAKLEAIKQIGVTRLSLGIESFDDEVLRENGRAHVSKEIFRCLPWIEEVGFDQLNIDLIAGMVGETEASWRESVAKTVDLAPDSVTVYQMELPFNTRFAHGVMDGSLERPLADWETKRAWHRYAFEELARAGYEMSSAYTMVKPGKGSSFVYRNSVWRGCDLLGTGVASFGHLSGVHGQNVDGWGEYIARVREGGLPLGRAFTTGERERLVRETILQMKLGRLDTAALAEKFGVDPRVEFEDAFSELEDEGFLVRRDDGVELTTDGWLRVDSLLPRFYDAPHRGARYT